MTQQINGMVRERLVNCATHFDSDQIEAVMAVLEDSGYSDMCEALKAVYSWYYQGNEGDYRLIGDKIEQALAKVDNPSAL